MLLCAAHRLHLALLPSNFAPWQAVYKAIVRWDEAVAQACRKAPGIKRLYTDGPYGGQCAQAIEKVLGIRVEVVRRPGNRLTGTLHDPQRSLWQEPVAGFVVLPKRWGVERTHPWGERRRRMVMHHDRKTLTSAAWVWLAGARTLLSRIASAN